jgi:hypothetical protein
MGLISHHHDDAAALAPVELKLETDLIKEYNQAVQDFANGAIQLLDGMTSQPQEEEGKTGKGRKRKPGKGLSEVTHALRL